MITIVSGLPRSGTSLMMQILEKAGLNVLTDNIRKADESNKKGYYEYEKVKKLRMDSSWLNDIDNKAIKIITQLLPYIPGNKEYRIIYMEREISEIIQSQQKMIKRDGTGKIKIDPARLAQTFQKQSNEIKQAFNKKPNVSMKIVSYNELLNNPDNILSDLKSFLETDVDQDILKSVINSDLYRERNK